MYIKRLKGWTKTEWELYFMQFPELSIEEQKEVKQILTLPTKKGIESNFSILKKYGIINGIGPGYFIKGLRKFISWLFKGVRYEWHDIEYGIGGTKQDKLNADNGLLKYSLKGINKGLIKAKLYFNPISMIFYYVGYYLQKQLAYFCYYMVRAFGGFGSFRFINYKKLG